MVWAFAVERLQVRLPCTCTCTLPRARQARRPMLRPPLQGLLLPLPRAPQVPICMLLSGGYAPDSAAVVAGSLGALFGRFGLGASAERRAA
jgi:hypothetical protein